MIDDTETTELAPTEVVESEAAAPAKKPRKAAAKGKPKAKAKTAAKAGKKAATKARNGNGGRLPKGDSKLAQLTSMLLNAKGVSLAQLQEKLGWQAHSVRGAIANLKNKQGMKIESERHEKRGRVYRIAA